MRHLEKPVFHVAHAVHGPSRVGPCSAPCLCWKRTLTVRKTDTLSFPLIIEHRCASFILVDNALAVAHIEIILSNFHRFWTPLFVAIVAARVCHRQDNFTFVLGFPTFPSPPPSTRPTRRILVSVFALDTRIRAHWPSPVMAGKHVPLFPLFVCMRSPSPTDRRRTELQCRHSSFWSCVRPLFFFCVFILHRSSFRRHIKFACYCFGPLTSFSPYDSSSYRCASSILRVRALALFSLILFRAHA